MPYLIDGHNLIPKIPGVSLQDLDDEQQLVELLQVFCRTSRQKVEVYFDRAPSAQTKTRLYGMVRAHYVSHRSSADEAIRTRLKQIGREAPNWKVVTSDQQVQADARRMRAEVIPSEVFARRLLEAAAEGERGEQIPQERAEDVDEWLRIFSRRVKK